MEEEADATAGERRFAQLNIDAIQQITALLPTSSLLALTSSCKKHKHKSRAQAVVLNALSGLTAC